MSRTLTHQKQLELLEKQYHLECEQAKRKYDEKGKRLMQELEIETSAKQYINIFFEIVDHYMVITILNKRDLNCQEFKELERVYNSIAFPELPSIPDRVHFIFKKQYGEFDITECYSNVRYITSGEEVKLKFKNLQKIFEEDCKDIKIESVGGMYMSYPPIPYFEFNIYK